MSKIREGNIVKGEVNGITDFGAFVDIMGTNRTGLVHISEVANGYVKNVNNHLAVGDKIRVKIININKKKNQIGLSWSKVPKSKKRLEVIHGAKFLPQDTRKTVGKNDVDNFHLLANRYLDKFESKTKFNRKEVFNTIKGKVKNIFKDQLYTKIDNRAKAQAQSLKESGYSVKSFEMRNDYRMAVGLGGANVLETNLCLHHIYGVPYIPGSSLKGLAKAYAVEKLRENLDLDYEVIENKLESEEIESSKLKQEFELYHQIFGTQKNCGQVNFMDAFPVGKINLKVDIMTPHFKDYYGEMESDDPKKNPTDYQEPNPIPFLVLEGQKFRFNLVSSKDKSLKEAYKLLELGLKELGIGAKTMVGYGYFE